MTDRGFILSYIKYGDNDAIVHCFTKNAGFQSLFVKGIYSAKNKKKAYLSPLNELSFSVLETHKRSNIQTISRIEKAEIISDRQDVRVSSILFFISEFLHQTLKNEMKQPHIYGIIKTFVNQVDIGNYQAHFSFLVEYLKILGVAPLYGKESFLDPETGCFLEEKNHHLFSEEISDHWKRLISEENIYDIKLKNALKNDFLESVLVYYHYHYPDFRTPKSLEVLKEIFS